MEIFACYVFGHLWVEIGRGEAHVEHYRLDFLDLFWVLVKLLSFKFRFYLLCYGNQILRSFFKRLQILKRTRYLHLVIIWLCLHLLLIAGESSVNTLRFRNLCLLLLGLGLYRLSPELSFYSFFEQLMTVVPIFIAESDFYLLRQNRHRRQIFSLQDIVIVVLDVGWLLTNFLSNTQNDPILLEHTSLKEDAIFRKHLRSGTRLWCSKAAIQRHLCYQRKEHGVLSLLSYRFLFLHPA